jgi:hypothetical protein
MLYAELDLSRKRLATITCSTSRERASTSAPRRRMPTACVRSSTASAGTGSRFEPRSTEEDRRAILAIKQAWHGHPDYSSYAIHEAVLDHGVRTPDEFGAYLARGRE